MLKRLVTKCMLGVFLLVSFGAVFSVPVEVQAQGQSQYNVTVASGDPNVYSKCEGWFFSDVGCDIAVFVVYSVWFSFSYQLAHVTGFLADFFLNFTIQSSSYRFNEVMFNSWIIVRNVVNIFFIAALLYTGFLYIMGKSTASKVLIRIILSALLVNFSLFGARLIIDVGNITARAIYQQIDVQKFVDPNQSSDPGVVKISNAVLNIANPQKILFGDGSTVAEFDLSELLTRYFFAGIMNIVMLFIFASIAILFITRTVTLFILGILVPIPIVVDLIEPVKNVVKQLKGIGSVLSWENWLNDYARVSAMAPVYCFFLYIIINIYSKGFSNNVGSSTGSYDTITMIINIIMPLVIVLFLFIYAEKVTKDLSGAFGVMVTKGINTVIGAVGGLALAGATMGASKVGGIAGKALQAGAASGMTPEARAAKLAADLEGKGLLARTRIRAMNAFDSKAQAAKARAGNYLVNDATYDPRNIKNTGAFKTFAKNPLGGAIVKQASQFTIADVDWGKASEMSYDERTKQRLKRAEEKKTDRANAINKAMDQHKEREDQRVARETSEQANKVKSLQAEKVRLSSSPTPENLTRIAAIDNELNSKYPEAVKLLERQNELINGTIAPVEQSDINTQQAVVVAIENQARAQEIIIKNPKSSEKDKNNARVKLVELKAQKLDEEAKLKQLKEDKDNFSNEKVVTLLAQIETDSASTPVERSQLEKDKKDAKLDDKKAKIKVDESEVKRLEAKVKSNSATTAEKDDLKAKRITLADDRKEVSRIEEEFRTRERDIKKKEDGIEKKKKAVETRIDKANEIENSLSSGEYLTDNSKSKAHAESVKELKQQYVDARSDPKKQQEILSAIHKLGQNMANDRATFANQVSFGLSLDKELLQQNDLNKKVAENMIATDIVEDMKNSYSNIAKGVIAATAGITAGLGVAAVTGLTSSFGVLASTLAGYAVGDKSNTAMSNKISSGVINERSNIPSKLIHKLDDLGIAIDNAWSKFGGTDTIAEIERKLRESIKSK